MRWHDLLFMHWPLRPEVLRPHIPSTLALDIFDGWAWLGVVPFRMSGVRPRCVPALPWVSAFPELNVRTYVTAGNKPGVWFFSLDAANPVAVWLAQWIFSLPYYTARMLVAHSNSRTRYVSTRTHRRAPRAQFGACYWPVGEVYHATPATLEHWLTERYCLYATDHRGRLWRGEIHHRQWPLQPAAADIVTNTMTEPLGIALPCTAPLLHFARRQDVVAWRLQPVSP
jgi:uncharacterized protein YqjF (DUF2071 family)